MLDADLRTKLLAAAAGAPVQQNYASRDKVQPRVWFQRLLGNTELLLDSAPALLDTTYAVEVGGLDPDEAGDIARAIYAAFHGFRGTMGDTRVLGAWVEDQSDEYEPRGISRDDGYHVFALNIKLLT